MKKWIAIYTKSRHEQIVVNELSKKDIESFCPMFKERRQWSDRKKWVHFPLFRSYVFARIHLKENIFVLQTIGVNKIVKFQNKISIIPDQVINDIKNIVDGGYKIQQVDYFIKGDEVSVVSGPLKGINGIIQDLKGDSRLIMKVEAIRQAFSIEISSEQLKLKKKNVSKVL
ncbi:MAG: UpxY family transcription antiterminator [Candidatus Neomarinimicrobiota bacterium]|nr:UpxY family transcription antiterminator [Candidatus Neomarinimicrobiota bacterium]